MGSKKMLEERAEESGHIPASFADLILAAVTIAATLKWYARFNSPSGWSG
jgi:hypothetical protein